jgi:3-deoxy-D-manno-octulosonic-acid transferase
VSSVAAPKVSAKAELEVAPIVRDPNPGPLRAALHGFYDLVWLAAIAASSPWWAARILFDPAFRAMARARLALDVAPSAPHKRLLIHGVSVGEVKGALPLVRGLAQRYPDVEIVISATTSTGLEVARKLFPGVRVVRFPLDPSPIVRRFLARIAPSCVVLMELEIWPNFLRECNRAAVPVAVVNGRITPKSYARYRLFRRTLPQFNRISLLCVQTEENAERFGTLCRSRERVLVTGNMKADGLSVGAIDPSRPARVELAKHLGPRPGQQVIVAGSTHGPEERLVAEAWLAGARDARLVLVPRHPQRADEVLKTLDGISVRAQLLTRLRRGEIADPALPAVVDTIGELETVYSLADLVFVGGSLVPHGGQNVLEPAALGRAVIHGPHVDNFLQEAALLERAGASRCVADGRELELALRELCADEKLRERMGTAGRAAVEAQKGATALTLTALSRLGLDGTIAGVAPARSPQRT